MAGFAKTILIALLVTVVFITFTNVIFFFPWYMTLAYETFNLSQFAANDNYLRQINYNLILNRLQNKPIFKDKYRDIEILPDYGSDYPSDYAAYADADKPYSQRGNPITVSISAVYPIRITIAGKLLEREIPVVFSLTVAGLRYYKDLDYYSDVVMP
jgi:hypothetical protein